MTMHSASFHDFIDAIKANDLPLAIEIFIKLDGSSSLDDDRPMFTAAYLAIEYNNLDFLKWLVEQKGAFRIPGYFNYSLMHCDPAIADFINNLNKADNDNEDHLSIAASDISLGDEIDSIITTSTEKSWPSLDSDNGSRSISTIRKRYSTNVIQEAHTVLLFQAFENRDLELSIQHFNALRDYQDFEWLLGYIVKETLVARHFDFYHWLATQVTECLLPENDFPGFDEEILAFLFDNGYADIQYARKLIEYKVNQDSIFGTHLNIDVIFDYYPELLTADLYSRCIDSDKFVNTDLAALTRRAYRLEGVDKKQAFRRAVYMYEYELAQEILAFIENPQEFLADFLVDFLAQEIVMKLTIKPRADDILHYKFRAINYKTIIFLSTIGVSLDSSIYQRVLKLIQDNDFVFPLSRETLQALPTEEIQACSAAIFSDLIDSIASQRRREALAMWHMINSPDFYLRRLIDIINANASGPLIQQLNALDPNNINVCEAIKSAYRHAFEHYSPLVSVFEQYFKEHPETGFELLTRSGCGAPSP
jgi:hypothetical protein